MPPKVKVSREEIINATVEIVRRSGAQAVNARTVAAALGCSTQPILSNFETMDALHYAVVERADAICWDYIRRVTESGEFPDYKASGMGYILFAREEKELFKLLYMRDRTEETDTLGLQMSEEMETMICKNTGLDAETVKLFHLEMWAFVHGIATMFATSFLDLDWQLVSKMLTDMYQGLRKQYEMG